MNLSRRGFLGSLAAAGAASAFGTGTCCTLAGCKKGQVAVQLYSIHKYIPTVGLEKALAEVAKIGYKGVEFAGYYGKSAAELKKILDDNGLVGCGTHVGRDAFSPANVKRTCEFNLGYGNTTIICPGGGNFPKQGENLDDFLKMLVDYYNTAAEEAAKYGCKIGLHNHTWEHAIKMTDGTSFWDYFFTNTCADVCMEQDVGWSTCAGVDCCEQYVKYPFRSPTLHAKENGMGKNVKTFDAILGQPGKPDATPVPWDRLFVASDKNKVEWYVVECERHFDDPNGAVKPSFQFLRSKGRC